MNKADIPSTDVPQAEGFQSLIIYKGVAYRTAGLRHPLVGEQYPAKTGEVRTYTQPEMEKCGTLPACDLERVILRPIVSLQAADALLLSARSIVMENQIQPRGLAE